MNIIMLKQTENEVLIEKQEVENLDLDTMYSLIGCELIDIKATQPAVWRGVGVFPDMLAVFDDEFLMTHEPVANPVASLLFGYLMHGQCLCGTVLLCKDGEEDMEGFSDEEADELVEKLNKLDKIADKLDFEVQEPKFEFVQF